jgi:hypothetical protein
MPEAAPGIGAGKAIEDRGFRFMTCGLQTARANDRQNLIGHGLDSASLAQELTSLNAASLDAKIVEMFETFSAV